MIEDEIVSRIEAAAARLDLAATRAQRDMMDRIEALIRGMAYNADGTFAQTAENQKKLTTLYNELRKVFTRGPYADAVAAYVSELGDIADLWDDYFAELIGSAFNPDRKLFERIWAEAAEITRESLTGQAIQQEIGRGAQAVLRGNILGRASAREAEAALKLFIEGSTDRDGKLLGRIKQISRDGASQFSRNYTQAVSASLGLEWYYYSGGTVRDSRDFCRHRQGQYFHKSEIEAWASLQWQGKIPVTNSATIFSYLGGYNCMHILRPVKASAVPAADRDRVAA